MKKVVRAFEQSGEQIFPPREKPKGKLAKAPEIGSNVSCPES